MTLPIRSNQPDGDVQQVGTGSSRTYTIQRGLPEAFGEGRAFNRDEPPVFVLSNLQLAAGFPWRAFKRHRTRATMLFVGLLTAVVLALVVTPKHYTIETRFFAEKNFVMPALGNPKRAVPTESDSPTRLASEAVLKRANLMEIVRQTKLLGSYDELRSPLGKVSDLVMGQLRGPSTDADKLDAMLGLLEKRMWVESEDGTITIGLDWSEPAIGFRIVQAAQQNFFEQRHASEVSLIGESIGIIEGHVVSAEKAIQDALGQIRAATPIRATPVLPRLYSAPGAPAPSSAVVAVLAELRMKRQTVEDINTSRSQRLSALQARLLELRGMYGSAHPEIAAAEENIRSLSAPSTQLASLRDEETALRARLRSLGGRESPAPVSAASFEPAFAREALERLASISVDSQEVPEVTFAKSRLKIATTDYEDLLDRLEGAKIEMETARAAFKYRYSVITPARIPKEPKSPKVPLVLIGGFILAVLVTAFAAVMLDFGSGRVLEAWQVDRQLGLTVLADVRRR